MKEKILVLISLLLALTFTLPVPNVQAEGFKALSSFSGGLILQSGGSPAFAYAVGLDIPTVTKKGNYQILTEITYLYSDRSFEAVQEIEAIRTVVTGRKYLASSVFFIGMGAGAWNIIDAAGENGSKGMVNVNLGATVWGIDAKFGADIVRLRGPDLYSLGLGVRILNL